jgi:hypothetical protein
MGPFLADDMESVIARLGGGRPRYSKEDNLDRAQHRRAGLLRSRSRLKHRDGHGLDGGMRPHPRESCGECRKRCPPASRSPAVSGRNGVVQQ